MGWSCKGICHRYKSTPHYTISKRCGYCGIFIEWEGLRCPCCGIILKIKPKNKKDREKLIVTLKVK